LYGNSLRRIANLETYSEQIGRRMQEADEWNAELQDENAKLEAGVIAAKAHGMRNTVLAAAGGLALGIFFPLIIKLLRKLRAIPV
jgi:hypothetical protein